MKVAPETAPGNLSEISPGSRNQVVRVSVLTADAGEAGDGGFDLDDDEAGAVGRGLDGTHGRDLNEGTSCGSEALRAGVPQRLRCGSWA